MSLGYWKKNNFQKKKDEDFLNVNYSTCLGVYDLKNEC